MKYLALAALASFALFVGGLSTAQAEAKLANVLISAPAGCCDCCYNPCIEYRHAGLRRACCCECGTIQTVLQVKDPCTCCVVAVPVCLPVCCTDTPEGCGRCGLFGRSIVRYDYCCGVSIIVTFNKCGDILVTYRGY
jgi:hypothetical protein